MSDGKAQCFINDFLQVSKFMRTESKAVIKCINSSESFMDNISHYSIHFKEKSLYRNAHIPRRLMIFPYYILIFYNHIAYLLLKYVANIDKYIYGIIRIDLSIYLITNSTKIFCLRCQGGPVVFTFMHSYIYRDTLHRSK